MTASHRPPAATRSSRQTPDHPARETRNFFQLLVRELTEVFRCRRLVVARAGHLDGLRARAKRAAPVFEKKGESFRSLPWRFGLNAHGGAGADRMRLVPKPLEHFLEDLKIVNT